MLSVVGKPLRITLRATLSVALLGLSAAGSSAAVERIAVSDIRPLLITALERGEAHGVLVGDAAQWVSQMFRTTAPIEIDVTTVRPLRAPGCKRLAITTTQDGVWDFNRQQRTTSAQRVSFTWSVNYCRDGSLFNEESP